jgi:hypothetical protein
MSPTVTPRTVTTPVERFADALLERDLPSLSADRRSTTVAFIGRRVDGLPSVTRLGVVIISRLVDVVGAVAGLQRTIEVVTSVKLPFLSEYPRLVRSLGYTYVWETWPATRIDGAA